MASFGWKRKVGEKVSRSAAQQFEAEAEKPEKEPKDEKVDWLNAIKRRREVLMEDCATQSKRLKEEGEVLAQQGSFVAIKPPAGGDIGQCMKNLATHLREALLAKSTKKHWEAIKKWDEAIQLTPDDPVLYEIKSQVLTILHEVFPAVKAAEMAVKFRPLWWEAWQTLGRAQINLGEVDLAVRSFQVAIHLCPSQSSLWQDDLHWAWRLQKQHSAAKEKIQQEEEAQKQIVNAPELSQDYDDFESDEVLAACVAVAERQTRYEELKRTAVVVDAEGNVTTRVTDAEDSASPSLEQFVKARRL